MRKLEVLETYRADTENEAKNFLEDIRTGAESGGYVLKKSGYEYKTKKAKGEIIDEAYICKITKVYGTVWNEE